MVWRVLYVCALLNLVMLLGFYVYVLVDLWTG